MKKARKVTDPDLLNALNSEDNDMDTAQPRRVTDPDLLKELSSDQKQRTEPKHTGDFGDLLKKALQQHMMGTVSNIGQGITGAATSGFSPENVEHARGIAEGVPKAIFSGASGLSQLFGGEGLPPMQLQESQSWPQSIGRALGETGAYGAMAAPFALGAEGFAPALAGSAAAGAALTPGDWKDRLAGGAKFAAPIALAKGLGALGDFTAKNIIPAARKVIPEKTYGTITKTYDNYLSKLGNLFKFVEKQADERGIKNVGELDNELFNQAKEYGHKTRSFNRIIERAKNGDYKDVRKLYSELGRQERLAIKSKNFERAEGLRDSMDMINEGLSEHFRQTGHHDLAQWLDTAKSGFAKLKNLFEPEKNATLRNLVGTERKIPPDLTPLMENRTSVKKILKEFPEVAKDVEAVKAKAKLKKAIKTAGKGLGYATALKTGSHIIHSGRED